MPIRAILFDLDGTLVDTERESAEAMARALAGHGVAVDQADRDFIIGRSWVAIYERLADRYPHLRWSRDELIAATAAAREQVFAELGITILPGARAAVDRVAHLPRALVTGSSRVEARQALGALGLVEAFRIVIAAEDVARSKPHPDGYLAAASQLGVAPGECLVIEDSRAGIAAGLAAGCAVLGVRAGNFHGQDQAAAHRVIETLDDLTDGLLAELGALLAGPGAPDYGDGGAP
jgi:mannitol-1-/sugar-/sorbitol-6-phosphatase